MVQAFVSILLMLTVAMAQQQLPPTYATTPTPMILFYPDPHLYPMGLSLVTSGAVQVAASAFLGGAALFALLFNSW
jgi:hypothetical protein